jgi:hypothetical protein
VRRAATATSAARTPPRTRRERGDKTGAFKWGIGEECGPSAGRINLNALRASVSFAPPYDRHCRRAPSAVLS